MISFLCVDQTWNQDIISNEIYWIVVEVSHPNRMGASGQLLCTPTLVSRLLISLLWLNAFACCYLSFDCEYWFWPECVLLHSIQAQFVPFQRKYLEKIRWNRWKIHLLIIVFSFVWFLCFWFVCSLIWFVTEKKSRE